MKDILLHEKMQINSFKESGYFTTLHDLVRKKNCELIISVFQEPSKINFYCSQLNILIVQDGFLLNSSREEDEEGALNAFTDIVVQSKKSSIPNLIFWEEDEEFISDINKLINIMDDNSFQKSILQIY